MRGHFEFRFHLVTPGDAAEGTVDQTLELFGQLGWEIRGIAPLRDDSLCVALQRRLDDESGLREPPAMSAALAEPLPPPLELLERELAEPDENVAEQG